MSIYELEAKAAELMEVRAQIEELEAMKTALEDAIKAAMADAGREEMKAGQYSLSWKTVSVSTPQPLRRQTPNWQPSTPKKRALAAFW